MAKYYAPVFLVVILIVGWIVAGLGERDLYRESATAERSIHAYDDPTTPIKDISITAYYFVPANKAADAPDSSWKEPLISALDDLKRFHEIQFAGLSRISYTIYPTAIIGKNPNIFYDTDLTERGNPHALESITDEIAASGSAASVAPGAYRVAYIIYDGVGASGTNHAALINRRFLVDPAYGGTRESLAAHEFYHTLGIPDGYDLATGTSTTADLMGLGRTTRPLKENYLERGTLAHLGL